MESNLSAALRQWLVTSGTRGVGRIADKSRRPAVRVLWTAAFVVCFALLLYHSQYLFSRYFNFDYTTATKEVTADYQVNCNNMLSAFKTVMLF